MKWIFEFRGKRYRVKAHTKEAAENAAMIFFMSLLPYPVEASLLPILIKDEVNLYPETSQPVVKIPYTIADYNKMMNTTHDVIDVCDVCNRREAMPDGSMLCEMCRDELENRYAAMERDLFHEYYEDYEY